MKAYQRMLNYVRIHTTSDENSMSIPTTACQKDLGKELVDEMLEIGFQDARMDELGYVYGTLPATVGCENATAIGFIAHMDTAPAFSGEHITPVLHENYNGEDVVLNAQCILRTTEFPFLKELKGKTLITTDGTTLLGADDKAGIAEILTACEELLQSGAPHGKICVAFTPDEEVGLGAAHFNVTDFGAKYAYTMDGGAVGGVEYDNFNAASAKIEVTGVSVHPGSAKGIMVNALLLLCEANAMLPANETPATTQDREGFYHLEKMQGDGANAMASYILRDHDAEGFAMSEPWHRRI